MAALDVRRRCRARGRPRWDLSAGGVFAPISDEDVLFKAVAVDGEFGTIVWPGDIDLDPDVLRGDQAPASGGLYLGG